VSNNEFISINFVSPKYKFLLPSLTIVLGFLFFNAVFVTAQVSGDDVVARRAQLEKELVELEKEIEVERQVLQTKQRESVSLERDIAIFDAKINSAELSIRARNLAIKRLANDIVGKEDIIDALTEKSAREKASLAQLLRKTRELDAYSIIEVVLGNQNLSEFFGDLDSFDSIKTALGESFNEIESTKKDTKREKDNLEGKHEEEEELKVIQILQKKRIEEDKGEKRQILKITKGEESRYQEIVRAKEKDAAAIRTELFVLQGTEAIPFEKALEFANVAFRKTGVRPALILGVIAEESNLGANVGTGNWKQDMHPKRDQPIFEEITRRLGLNPDLMPVSRKPWYGWGGAMGPAQFIPSTWVLYEDKIAKLTKHNPPNPWDPFDAFIASAILLKDNGAARGGYTAERLAALRYFAGWKNSQKAAYSFYGDDVMSLASKYQRQIDILQGS